jgi:small ligand-binding sensory domain FIST
MALDLAVEQVLADDDPDPDVVLLFANPAVDRPAELVRQARERTRARTLIGCVASAVLANGEDIQHRPGLSLMALWLPGAEIHPVRLHQEHVDLFDDGELWRQVTGAPADRVNAWLVIAEPFRIDVQAVLAGLGALYPGGAIIGGLASGMPDRQASIFFDGQVYDEGGVALAIGGPYRIEPFVSQGCEQMRPSTSGKRFDPQLTSYDSR